MRLFLALFCFAPLAASAQTVVTPRGDAATFDVAAWNVESFGSSNQGPSNDESQLGFIKDVIRGSEIELWALQEVADEDDFNALMDSLSGNGYVGVLGPQVSSNATFDLKLAFIYNPSVLTVTTSRSILESDRSDFSGRLPLELEATATLNGTSVDLRIITLHAQAGDERQDRTRRTKAADALKTYTDNLLAQGVDVIVLGDFNDELTTSTASGTSPYSTFVASADYQFATQAIDDANIGTFCDNDDTCSGRLTLDHVLTSKGLFNGVLEGDRYSELTTEIPQYTQTTSDHLPVLARIDLAMAVDAEDALDRQPVALTVASPMRGASTLTVGLEAPTDITLDVFDVQGRRVARLVDGALGTGTHPVLWNGSGVAPGLYIVRLRADAQVISRTVTRVR